MGERVLAICLYRAGMEGIGVGFETKVERRMPIGEGVMVILMESSMSAT